MLSPEFAELLGAVGDTALDAAMDPSIWRDLPIVGMFQKGAMAVAGIRAKHFARKLKAFLEAIASASQEDREKFLNQFRTEQQEQEFNDQILFYLDQADSFRKPRIIGQLMVACIHGHLPLDKAKRLCAMVNRCYMEDLKLLLHFQNGVQGEDQPIAESLQAVGFLSNEGSDSGGFEPTVPGGTLFAINEYGRWLVQFGGLSADE